MSLRYVSGLPELIDALKALPNKLRQQALRNALAAGGRVIRDEARRVAPVLLVPKRRASGEVVRKPGTLRKAITVRTSKRDRRDGNVGVYVNVRPAKGSARGANSPDDPYYWRWLEFGRRARAGVAERVRVVGGLLRGVRGRKARRAVAPLAPRRFLRTAAQRVDGALAAIVRKLGPEISKMNRKGGTR